MRYIARNILVIIVLLFMLASMASGQQDAGGKVFAAEEVSDAVNTKDGADGVENLDPGLTGEDETKVVDDSLLTNIVIDVDALEGAEETRSIFDWEKDAKSEALRQKVALLLKDASFQSRVKNFDATLDIYDQILKIDPGNKLAEFNRGITLLQAERYKEALEVLLPLTKEYPENAIIKNNLAWVYATATDVSVRNGERAVSYARSALLLQPRDVHIWNTISESYFISTEYEKALKRAETALYMAVAQNLKQEDIKSAVRQVRKCRQAVAAMSVMK